MTHSVSLRRPDDWHLHLRDGDMLAAVAAYSSHFGRAIIMPNLVPPVVTGAQAAAYRDRILAVLPENVTLRPLMTLYLTETTDPDDVVAAHAAGLIAAVKLYPAGATTNSASGVRDFDKVRPVLEAMAEAGIPLCTHGEVTDPASRPCAGRSPSAPPGPYAPSAATAAAAPASQQGSTFPDPSCSPAARHLGDQRIYPLNGLPSCRFLQRERGISSGCPPV